MVATRVANGILNAQRAGMKGFPHDLYWELRKQPTLTWLEPENLVPSWAVT